MRAALFLLIVGSCKKAAPEPAPAPSLAVEIDGQSVWPPQGEDCDTAVACCEAMAQVAPPMNLACQLAAARGGTCAELVATAVQMYAEMTQSAPPDVCLLDVEP